MGKEKEVMDGICRRRLSERGFGKGMMISKIIERNMEKGIDEIESLFAIEELFARGYKDYIFAWLPKQGLAIYDAKVFGRKARKRRREK